MNILDKIVSVKKQEVRTRKVAFPLATLENSEFFGRVMPSFRSALAKPGPSIIGEFKRKSPSRGDINPSASLKDVAKGYQAAGISAMSVLTDEQFFGGSNDDLSDVAGILAIPVLRKDFIVDEYQVTESKSRGASAILLIASILSRNEVDKLSRLAGELGLDVLLEIHDMQDLDKATERISIIGVNNRDLKSFTVSMSNSEKLLDSIPGNCLRIAESGFRTPEDVSRLYSLGYDAFLIGETFMLSADPGKKAETFINETKAITG